MTFEPTAASTHPIGFSTTGVKRWSEEGAERRRPHERQSGRRLYPEIGASSGRQSRGTRKPEPACPLPSWSRTYPLRSSSWVTTLSTSETVAVDLLGVPVSKIRHESNQTNPLPCDFGVKNSHRIVLPTRGKSGWPEGVYLPYITWQQTHVQSLARPH